MGALGHVCDKPVQPMHHESLLEDVEGIGAQGHVEAHHISVGETSLEVGPDAINIAVNALEVVNSIPNSLNHKWFLLFVHHEGGQGYVQRLHSRWLWLLLREHLCRSNLKILNFTNEVTMLLIAFDFQREEHIKNLTFAAFNCCGHDELEENSNKKIPEVGETEVCLDAVQA